MKWLALILIAPGLAQAQCSMDGVALRSQTMCSTVRATGASSGPIGGTIQWSIPDRKVTEYRQTSPVGTITPEYVKTQEVLRNLEYIMQRHGYRGPVASGSRRP